MNLLRKAIQSSIIVRAAKPNHGLPLFLHQSSARRFSTEAEQPPQDYYVDPFLQSPPGLVYGKLSGTQRHTLKTDVVKMLEGCNLTLEDVKVEYNYNFLPVGMMVQFSSRTMYENALKAIIRKGRLFKLERADRSQWDLLIPYDSKAIVLHGIPGNAAQDDVERFLSGFEYDGSIQYLRQLFSDRTKVAVVRFVSKTQAMNAYLAKNRGFCLNNQISVRVLQ